MTSIAIISGAVARIEHLKKQVQSDGLVKVVERLLRGLKNIKRRLTALYNERRDKPGKLAVLEKETVAVQLSYEIVDAIADAWSKYKEKSTALIRLPSFRRNGNVELEDLNQKLDELEQSLEKEQQSTMPSPFAAPNPGHLQHNLENKETNWETITVLLDRLREDLSNQPPDSSPLVFIQGKSGMGKTTLAKKLFQDHQLRKTFDVCAWVSINRNFQIKRVLQTLLQQLGSRQKSEISSMNEIELIGEIFAALDKKKYLLVLDDLGVVEEWRSIRLALPMANSSKIIITTSSEKADRVATQPKAAIYKISGIVQSDILTIVKETTSFNPDSNVAKAICDVSGGSPLIAIILGKCLDAEAATTSEQQLVQELQSYIPHAGTPLILKACYKRLAPEFKPCLLYLGMFPRGQDIEVEKLYMLLEAEDLIMSSEESQQPRRDVLEELARKKLVEVQEDILSKCGFYKSCRLQDQVHEFCTFKGSEEELFEIVDFETKNELRSNVRRLAINLSKYRDDKFIIVSSPETSKKIRSLLIFDTFKSGKKSRWPSYISDFKEFSRLNVLSFEGVDFRSRKVPKGIEKLRLLRFLSFRGCWLEELASSLSKLTQLETLDLLVHAECKMFIPSSILTNMTEMVHLYLPMLYECEGKSKLQLHGLERLETLVNFDMESCHVDFSQLDRLKIFKAISKENEDLNALFKHLVNKREENAMLQLSMHIKNFDRYSTGSVSNLTKLLESQLLHSIHVEGQIGELAVEGNPGRHVVEIVLDGSELEHDPMNVLGRFQNIRSLGLTNDAVVTSEIVISAASLFPKLRSLKLLNLHYLTKLTIEEGAMPELSFLEIESCPRLHNLSIPDDVKSRLMKAEGDIGFDAYSVMSYLLPSSNIITTDQVPSTSDAALTTGVIEQVN